MAQDDKFEERKRYNEPFLKAFDYLAGEKNMNQKQFAAVIDAESSYISNFRHGKKRVGDDYMARLADAFAAHFEGKGHLNMDYLLGISEYMLVENVPDEEILEKISRGSNPDYDVIMRKKNARGVDGGHSVSSIDESSLLNSSLTAYIQLANRLTDDLKAKEQELADRLADKDTIIREKDARIVTLERTIADKDAIIRDRDARILSLERQIAAANMSDITDYPFAVGVADRQQEQYKL